MRQFSRATRLSIRPQLTTPQLGGNSLGLCLLLGFERMPDTMTPQERSERMSRVRGKDTRPERAVRSVAHGMGYRYRLHRKDLPGCPDLVFPGRGKVVFVHGCFWHRHPKCRHTRTPKSRVEFWTSKFARNVERDQRNIRELQNLGWEPLVVWECQTTDREELTETIRRFLEGDS